MQVTIFSSITDFFHHRFFLMDSISARENTTKDSSYYGFTSTVAKAGQS
jgi:hypothetical protein